MAWSLATGAAVTLSWWGVHTVMAGTAYDPPRALPLPADGSSAQRVMPVASSTQRPPSPSAKPSPSASTASPGESHRPAASRPAAKPERSPARSTPPAATGQVRSYTVDGGRVVFDIGADTAELVSATPDAGWQMQAWTQPTWIRVTFTRNGREVSVFCTWNDHPPMVQFDDR
ncbi:hypothetical protein [Streptomyces sp. AK02-01A]|uniref:hypothetical protein n=1 Tax=Streptomyces sp. AK02-01A TaxID=3028648 RepID=UPI0029A07FE4|nr:hypothetical protein [Streptomyces sp. AK02-01A]MDX3849196.1 hypothetical protein [Streptomyces sp. AK02-01A]